jgi:putative hydrolase of the HAD superfamily
MDFLNTCAVMPPLRGSKNTCCVLFDLDGTLYDSPAYTERVEKEIISIVSRRLGISREQARAELGQRRKKLLTLTRTLESLGIDREHFFRELAERIDPTEYIAEDLIVREIIVSLRGRGIRVGLVSNSGRVLVEKVLRAIGLEMDSFDVVVTSSESEPKPSPQPFLLALSRLGVDRSRAMYVGDRDEAELRPAKELGIKTILLDRTGVQESRWADHVIRTIGDVPSISDRAVQ